MPHATRFLERKRLSWVAVGILALWAVHHYTVVHAVARQTNKASMLKKVSPAKASSTSSSNIGSVEVGPNDKYGSNGKNSTSKLNYDPTELKVMTWNIEGLLSEKLSERTRAVISTVLKKSPDAIFFQELVSYSYELICKSLRHEYGCIRGRKSRDSWYFVGIFFRKERFTMEDHAKIPYSNSAQNRILLTVKLYLLGPVKTQLVLMTSHLESLRRNTDKRLEQLKQGFKYGNEQPNNYNVIFGGDLNLENGEDKGVMPGKLKDLWVACGSPTNIKYTWDSTQNHNEDGDPKQVPRVRYDRLYFRSSTSETMQLKKLDLLGKELVGGTKYYPSDHWGVIATFKLLPQNNTKETAPLKCTAGS